MANTALSAEAAAQYIREEMSREGLKVFPKIGLVLGSGLGELADELENPVVLDYENIPGFPGSTAPGHRGRLVAGLLKEKPLVVMQGRFHYYEGYTMEQVAFPVRVFKLLGLEALIITNASGGINTAFKAGDLMLIRDHIKLAGDSPLRGPNDDRFGPRFNDMSDAYGRELRKKAREASEETGVELREGIYAYMTGPSFESPAEIRMLRVLGADAVGMSTVPEVITAAHAGLPVLAISTVTNLAAGILDAPLSHEEVLEMGKKVKEKLLTLLRRVVEKL